METLIRISTSFTACQLNELETMAVHTTRATLIRQAVQEFLDRQVSRDALPAPAPSRLGASAFGSGVTS